MRIWVKPDKLAKLGLTRAGPACAPCSSRAPSIPPGRVGAEPAPRGAGAHLHGARQGPAGDPEEFGDDRGAHQPRWLGRAPQATWPASSWARSATTSRAASTASPPPSSPCIQAPGANALDRRRTASRTRCASSRSASPATSTTGLGLDTTLPVTEGIKEIATPSGRGHGAGHPGGVPLPPELARHPHPADRGAGVADRHLRLLPVSSASPSTRSRCSAWCSPSAWWWTTPSSWSRRWSTTSRQGSAPRDATLKAMSEVSGPVVGIALVLSSVFIPIGFMSGIQGRLNKQFAVTIAISVLISAFNALSFLAGALGAAPPAPPRVEGAPGPLLRRLQPLVRPGHSTATWACSGRLIRKTAVSFLVLGGLRAPGRRPRAPTALRLHPRRGPGLPDPERPAPRRRLLPAHPRGDRQDREAARADPRRALRDHHQRLQPLDPNLGVLHGLLLPFPGALGRGGTGLSYKAILGRREPAPCGHRSRRRSPSPSRLRPSPASAPRAASRSGCRTAAAGAWSSSPTTCRSSWKPRASGRSSRT